MGLRALTERQGDGMKREKLNRELARAVANLSGQTAEQSDAQDGAIPDIVNDAELMGALKRAYDGAWVQRGEIGDARAYLAEAGFSPNRSSACGPTAHEALGRALVQYLQKAACGGMFERRSGKDRRCRTDRRSWAHRGVTYPFIDGHGVLITTDRRVRSDPRLNSLVAYWGVDRRSE